MRKKPAHQTMKAPTQRQQRVAEEIRHILSAILQRQEIWCEQLQRLPITISEVKVSIDIRHAFIFVMPLGGQHIEETLSALKSNAAELRKILAREIHLKAVPQLHFHTDTMFENVDRIERLLNQPHVLQDLAKD